MTSLNASHIAAVDAAARHRQRSELLGLNAYDRHKRFVHDLVTYYGGKIPESGTDIAPAVPIKTDEDSLKESYRFIRNPEDDAEDSWEVRLAKKYYSRLFREYCIADLSRYKEGQVGLRWRTQREVVAGRGQFTCGTRGCEERRGLASFEVPFGYEEAGQRKQALVKVRLCPEHAYQLNYKKNREAEIRQEKKRSKKDSKRSRNKRRRKNSSSSSSESDNDSSSSGGSEDEEEKNHKHPGQHRQQHSEKAPHKTKAKESPSGGEGGSKSGKNGGFDEFFAGLFE